LVSASHIVFRCDLASVEAGPRRNHPACSNCPACPTQAQADKVEAGRLKRRYAGPEWLHEIKHDGFRIRLERDGDRVRLITRGGNDWTKRLG